jgi:hypothetical protein
MAREAGIELDLIDEDEGQIWYITTEGIKAFEALVRADERETFNKERQQYADWFDEAAADIEDWGMYASEYLQKKWDLPDQVQDYKSRATAIRAKGNT